MASISRSDHAGIAARRAVFLEEWANWSGLTRLHITFDVDWAPDYMLRHVLAIIEPYNVGVTLFATHDSPLLRQVAKEGRHEVGIHPNLSPQSSQGAGIDAVLRVLTGWYTGAVGCRFHVLGFSYRDLMELSKTGIRYDVSRLMYNTSHLQPAYHRDLQLTLIPYMWEDGICENVGDEVTARSMELDAPGLKVLNFHPMNVFINGPTVVARRRFINSVGPLLDCPEHVARQHRQEGDTGAQRALEGLLNRIRHSGLIAQPLRTVELAFTELHAGER